MVVTTKKTEASQRAFLAAYGEHGKVTHAAKAAGVTPQAVYKWKRSPEFRERLDEAGEAFADKLEQMAPERLEDPKGNRGSDVLLMALLNANRPDKYRPNREPTDDTALSILTELRAIRKQRREERKALTEGTITVDEQGQPAPTVTVELAELGRPPTRPSRTVQDGSVMADPGRGGAPLSGDRAPLVRREKGPPGLRVVQMITRARLLLTVAGIALLALLGAAACSSDEPPEPSAPEPATAPSAPARAVAQTPAADTETSVVQVAAKDSAAAESGATLSEPEAVEGATKVVGPRSGDEDLAPELTDITAWLNSEPFTLESTRGSVVLIDFWTYTCINCIRTLPYLKDWHEKYADEGLLIVGVHAPEFQFEHELENVRGAVGKFGLEYPIAQDNNYGTWRAYKNRAWPAKYLIDKDGYIRYTHFGEGAYIETEQVIRELLAESGSQVASIEPSLFPDSELDPKSITGDAMTSFTRELYAGYERNYGALTSGSAPPYVQHNEYYEAPDRSFQYEDPGDHTNHFIYLQGFWNNAAESLNHARETEEYEDYIGVRFFATEVNAVMEPRNGEPYEVRVLVDDMPITMSLAGEDIMWDAEGNSFILVSEPKLYRVVRSPSFGEHELRLSSNSQEFSLFAFTFGSYLQESPER